MPLRTATFSLIWLLLGSIAHGQNSTKMPTLVLPDGRVLAPDKFDSLEQAWGKGRVQMRHSKEDDKNNTVHLIRMTDEQKEKNDSLQNAFRQRLIKMIGRQAPDFTLTDMDDKAWSLKTLRGKVVVLNFWFTACSPCIEEMPRLNQLAKNYTAKDVVFLAITFSSPGEVQNFLKRHEFAYHILPGSHEVDLLYQIYSWPTSFVIDRTGKVRLADNDSRDIGRKLGDAIDRALSGTSSPVNQQIR